MSRVRKKKSRGSSLTEATEALVIVDMVNSARMASEYGWRSVGREMLRTLREISDRILPEYGLFFRKFTGDGYLFAFRHHSDFDLGIVQAMQAIIRLARDIKEANQKQPIKQKELRLRFAVHFGEVDVVESENGKDREGLEVAYAFRMENRGKKLAKEKVVVMDPVRGEIPFPIHDYAFLSERTQRILKRNKFCYHLQQLGPFNLEEDGFVATWHSFFLLKDLSELDPNSLFSEESNRAEDSHKK